MELKEYQKEVIADLGDEDAFGVLSTQARDCDRLVGTLSAWIHQKTPAGDRLPRRRYLLPGNDHVGVRAAQNDYLFHVRYYSTSWALAGDGFCGRVCRSRWLAIACGRFRLFAKRGDEA